MAPSFPRHGIMQGHALERIKVICTVVEVERATVNGLVFDTGTWDLRREWLKMTGSGPRVDHAAGGQGPAHPKLTITCPRRPGPCC